MRFGLRLCHEPACWFIIHSQVKSVEDGSEDDDASSDDDSEDEDEDSEEEHEQTPNKVDGSKKRAAESSKTPVQKKAKFVTPEKIGGKQGAVHTATPYPSKQALKKPTSSDQAKQQSSKSSGSGEFRCNPCNRYLSVLCISILANFYFL